jgi:hypothetical protein
MDDVVWNHAVFSKNRDRLLTSEVAQRFFAEAYFNKFLGVTTPNIQNSTLASATAYVLFADKPHGTRKRGRDSLETW